VTTVIQLQLWRAFKFISPHFGGLLSSSALYFGGLFISPLFWRAFHQPSILAGF
jgi:hypothetical protein